MKPIYDERGFASIMINRFNPSFAPIITQYPPIQLHVELENRPEEIQHAAGGKGAPAACFQQSETRAPSRPLVKVSAACVGTSDTDRVLIRSQGMHTGKPVLAICDVEMPPVGNKEVSHLAVDAQRCRS